MIATEDQHDEQQPTRRLIWILADDDEEPALKALRSAGIAVAKARKHLALFKRA
jgi:hypothetical protein